MVGEIAERHLTMQARREVALLLRRDRLADRTLSHRATLGEIASWADEIKDYPWGRKLAAWHFDDVPLCEPPEPGKYCRNGRCASAQIEAHLALLKDRGATMRRRNEALKWVVHLVGDIHQPLHASDRRDRGGNAVLVSFFGRTDNAPYGPINLHAIWDVHLVQRLVAERGGEAAIAGAAIAPAEKAAWEKGSLQDWVAESHALARDAVYPALRGAGSCAHPPQGIVAVGEAYYANSAPIIEAQIRKAGIRLAKVLNQAFEP